jgi:hypothetical protein
MGWEWDGGNGKELGIRNTKYNTNMYKVKGKRRFKNSRELSSPSVDGESKDENEYFRYRYRYQSAAFPIRSRSRSRFPDSLLSNMNTKNGNTYMYMI